MRVFIAARIAALSAGRTARTAGVLIASLACLVMLGCMAHPAQKEELATEVTDFDALYGKNCAGCHGADGKRGAAHPLNDPLYLKLVSKEQVRQIVELGRGGMPAFAESQGGALLPKQVDALLEGLEQHWARPVNIGNAKLPAYSIEGETGNADQGQQVYQRVCTLCHGKNSRVGSITDASYLQLVTNQYLRTNVIVGRRDMGMPDWRTVAGGHALSDQDIADVVEYLASQRPTTENSMNAPTTMTKNDAPGSTAPGKSEAGGTPDTGNARGATNTTDPRNGRPVVHGATKKTEESEK